MKFVAPDLRLLDGLKADCLALTFFADELPPRGTAGLVDWRYLGLLSRKLLSGEVGGHEGELVLLPGKPRILGIDKLVLCGAGNRSELTETVFTAVTTRLLDALVRLAGRSCVLALPGDNRNLIAPERAMDLLLQVAPDREELELTLIEGGEAHKRMVPVLDRHRQKQRAAL